MKLGHWISLVALLVSLYILWQIRHILLLSFTAIVLATALNRSVRQLQRLGIKRSIAVFLSVATLFALLAIFISLIGLPFSKEFHQLIERAPQGIKRLHSWFTELQNLLPKQSMEENKGVMGLTQLYPVVNSWISHFFTFFSDALAVALEVLLVLILTVMLLVTPLSYRRAFLQLFPSFYRHRADEILSRCDIGRCCRDVDVLFFNKKNSRISLIASKDDFSSASLSLLPGYCSC